MLLRTLDAYDSIIESSFDPVAVLMGLIRQIPGDGAVTFECLLVLVVNDRGVFFVISGLSRRPNLSFGQ